jgi:small-conductance mechanosensitive channel
MECGEWVAGDLYNGRIVRVANSFVCKEPVVNYSADFPFLWDEILIPVRHGSDIDVARRIIGDVAQEVVGEYARQAAASWVDVVKSYRIEDASVNAMITLEANENWVTFTLRHVVDYRKRRTTKDALWTRILAGLAEADGLVALASTSILVDTPGIDVRLVRSEPGVKPPSLWRASTDDGMAVRVNAPGRSLLFHFQRVAVGSGIRAVSESELKIDK